MSHARRLINIVVSILMILSMGLSFTRTEPASAQGGDSLKRQFNAQTDKVSFIGPENGRTLSAAKVFGISSAARPADPAMALAKRFGPEFGLKNPERELAEMKTNRPGDGRVTVRYQQNHQGIPVMGGELIINTNENGDLYSINGEVSSNISLSTQPTIDGEQAHQTALQSIAKWYQKTPEDFIVSEPALWIYDESLLQPSTRPAELVWRMEVTPLDNSMPVRELVLINAHRGSISLHFNQVDTAWGAAPENANTVQTSEIAATISTSTNSASYTDTNANNTLYDSLSALAATTWYVATTGNNSNSCSATGSPCLTINGAIAKAAPGDTIKIAIGTYAGTGTEVVLINKNVTLSGGWNASFTTQSGTSTIDGQAARRGIMNNSGVTSIIERFVVQNCYTNDGTGGAGIYNYGGTITLKESTISSNDGGYSGSGGGIVNVLGGVLIINSSTISGNKVNLGEGGGIANGYEGTVTLNNSTVSGNVTNFAGSGISMAGGTLTVNNSTIYGNISTYYGSSGAGINNASGGSISIRNTIIAGNTNPTNQGPDCEGSIVSLGYNLIGSVNSSNCTFTPTMGDIIGPHYSPINPRLAPLQDNGGPTLTHALMTGSPAIDGGNPATPGSGGNACLVTDQRGVARPVGTRCDIGAYEGSVAWTPTAFVNTYTANSTSSLPGTFLCNETQPNCTNNANPHADAAHKYAIGTYNFYAAQHNRDSLDNNGMTIISSVHYCRPSSCPYSNAFWDGEQIVYGDASGWPLADDVVAHEFTHGVTQYESNLFYYYQSGAINESFSDLWGEYYDQTNGLGTDTAGVKWQFGEDISGLGAIRSMNNPPAFGDPDKMSSPNYYEGADDSGGVHTNSGLNNKAVFLLVDGGTFNGKTVSALGWDKTAAIYYEVNTNLLSSGADYSDLYYALQQACSNLIGQKGITSGDCTEVKDAVDAVEMNAQPAPNFNTDVALCEPGAALTIVFTDDLETGTANWTFTNGTYTRWQYDSPYEPYAQSGTHSLYADDYPDTVTDATARLASFTVPSNAYLHFAHAYDFETSDYYYDGGALEYSINGGSTWVDAGSLMDFNGYKGTIFTGAGNPLSGRSAFVGTSHGYISTRLNLASLAGQNVTFRWRMGLDEAVSAWGWWLDNLKVYRCVYTPATLLSPSGDIGTNYAPTYAWNKISDATWYYLWVNGPSGNVIKQWYDASLVCGASTCSATPTTSLKGGNHTFWVQTWNSGGYGPWSAGKNFSTTIPTPPGAATLASPNGNIGTNYNPTYTWNKVSDATWYYLWVNGPSGNVIKQWYDASAVCGASTCAVTPSKTLAGGAHTWFIQTWNPGGYGPWSAGMSFSTTIPIPPGVATLVSPSGPIIDTTPTYTWNKVTGATWYYLWVNGPSGNVIKAWYEASVVCGASTCSFTPATTLGTGAHTFWVQTWNSAGYGPWSSGMNFSLP